jgi:hypothetical protein
MSLDAGRDTRLREAERSLTGMDVPLVELEHLQLYFQINGASWWDARSVT